MRILPGFPALLLALLILSGCGEAPKDASEQQTSKAATASTALSGDPQKGRSLYMTCSTCHGQNAEGMASLQAPALADQEPYYLRQQLNNFRQNKRGVHPKDAFGAQMMPMAKVLNSEGIEDVIAYIKSKPSPTIAKTMEGNAENGKTYYNMICGACHGPGATGIESLHSPRLVGMQDWYLERQLNNFRTGVRGLEEGDTFGAQMQQIAVTIPDDQTVKDLIAYINSLQAE